MDTNLTLGGFFISAIGAAILWFFAVILGFDVGWGF